MEAKNNALEKNMQFDIRLIGEALNDLLHIYSLMGAGYIPKSSQTKIAIQNSIKEFCMAILDCL